MRFARLAVVLVATSLLTGCVSTAELETPVETPSESPAVEPGFDADLELCAERIEDFDIPLWEALEVLPDIDESPESTAVAKAFERAGGACAPAATQPRYESEPCEPALAAPDDLMRVAPDQMDYMFHAGAVRQISGAERARTAEDGDFLFAVAAWRFRTSREASVAPILGAVAACPGAVRGDDGAVTVSEGAEPHVRVVVDGTDLVYLRSVRLIAPDGTAPAVRTTESGLLPAASFDAIDAWWRAEAPSLLDAQPSEP
ncbi:hypothetical protein KZX37_05945 [Microbacterium sp. EYE_5]|uniref:hypothetical protein n=1 Tax=unclassified Microbacterium TaxID=2609290 RepID=UPI0020039669|nr:MULTISPECIES: hypothetical protein [unclassified Microbacterium]MCK6080163.1 hypothetical protein [Microbacterium sp. EYE_382]MCK6085434.1 hypothetical protein [Microbacterium sp. EYE_384]MCK6122341.1 hypothetical protein [Microbacterium sp. EYE_80]MCK6126197.1 hypothetical protein [Microbacterium sp. EYE_79]MCK6141118.1 hypothetical protein [Microbacterium sp. EYE_39]